ncbi:MAG: phosphatase PAP2 family protein [Actinomycetota bacterium]
MRALGTRARLVVPAPSDVLTPTITALVVLALGSLGLLAALAHRHLLSWDRPVRSGLRGIDSDAFGALMDAATKFGSRWVIAALTVSAALLAWRRCRQLAIVLVVAFPAALVLELTLKALIDRPRPSFALGFGASFPSGHVLAATAFWGLIPPLVFIITRSRAAWSVSVAAIAVVLLGVGTSRVYLGAHWPSDVVGAYFGGAIFLLVAEWAVRRPWRRLRCEACDLHPLGSRGLGS